MNIYFKVYRKTKSGNKLYLSFRRYCKIMGIIEPFFTKNRKQAPLLTNWTIYEMTICCPDFIKKYKGKFIKQEINF